MDRRRSWKARTVGRVGVVAVMVLGLVMPGVALATADEEPQPSLWASSGAGACGSWWHETAQRSVSLSVCGTDGAFVEQGQEVSPGQLAGPAVFVDLYSCTRRACVSERHEGAVDMTEVRIDPLLRTAVIQTTIGGCVIDVNYWAIGGTRPDGYASGSHALPFLEVGSREAVTRQAEWTGRVCGEQLGGRPGSAELWRGTHVQIVRSGPWGPPHEHVSEGS